MVFFSSPLGSFIFFFFLFALFWDFLLFIKGTKLKKLLRMVGEVCVPYPDLNDPTTPTTTIRANMAPPSDCPKTEAPGHQSGNTGG